MLLNKVETRWVLTEAWLKEEKLSHDSAWTAINVHECVRETTLPEHNSEIVSVEDWRFRMQP